MTTTTRRDIELTAGSAEQEVEEWLCKTLQCEIDWFSDEYARFDLALYLNEGYDSDFYAIPYAFAEVKERFITKDRYDSFRLDRSKFEYARSIWQTEETPCYLAVAWLDYYGLVDLTKLTDDQVTYDSGWITDPMLGRRLEEAVYIPISLFTNIELRGADPK